MSQPEIRSIDTPLLRIAVEVRNPGPSAVPAEPVVLLHGWPDDVRAWDRVASALIARGRTTIAPWGRGYGATAFKSDRTIRSGQVAAQAQDVIDLLDAMNLPRVTIIGHDWGARTAYALAALWPDRIRQAVICSAGYETGMKTGNQIEPEQARAYWYQWFWHSERGREALEGNAHEVCKLLWKTWSPSMKFSEDEFQATAAAWRNPDWVAITQHSYRVRWGAAERDPRYEALEKRFEQHPKINVPIYVLHGEEDGASLVASSAGQEKDFTNFYTRKTLPGVGHFIPREDPAAIVAAFEALDGESS